MQQYDWEMGFTLLSYIAPVAAIIIGGACVLAWDLWRGRHDAS